MSHNSNPNWFDSHPTLVIGYPTHESRTTPIFVWSLTMLLLQIKMKNSPRINILSPWAEVTKIHSKEYNRAIHILYYISSLAIDPASVMLILNFIKLANQFVICIHHLLHHLNQLPFHTVNVEAPWHSAIVFLGATVGTAVGTQLYKLLSFSLKLPGSFAMTVPIGITFPSPPLLQ